MRSWACVIFVYINREEKREKKKKRKGPSQQTTDCSHDLVISLLSNSVLESYKVDLLLSSG